MFVRTEQNKTVEIYNSDEVHVKPTGNAQWTLYTVDDEDNEEAIDIEVSLRA